MNRDRESIKLSGIQFTLLHEILANRAPDLLAAIAQSDSIILGRADRLRMQNVLADELCDTGLEETDDPNARGYEIEALIDIFSPYK